MAFLSGYDNRRTLYHVKDGVVKSDYQTKLVPTEGASAASGETLTADFQADFDDIRITKGDNAIADQWRESYSSGVSANYWHELNKIGSSLLSGNAASGQAVVNVNAGTICSVNDYVVVVDDNLLAGELCQISSISTNALTMTSNLAHAFTTAANAKVAHMHYAYYKNASATLSSNGGNTFTFFDDFSGDESKWTDANNIGSISGGIFTITGSGAWQQVSGNTALGATSGALRTLARLNAANNLSFGLSVSDESHNAKLFYAEGSRKLQSKDGTTASGIASNWTSDTYKTFDILAVGGTNSRYFENGVELTGSPKTTNPPNSASLVAFFNTCYNGVAILVDWILLRSYVSGVTWGTWGSEESAGWANIAKVDGATATDLAKVRGIAVADIAKVSGVAV